MIVEALAADGWTVVAASRSGRMPDALPADLAARVTAVALDVAVADAPEAVIRDVTATTGPIACS
ncbi:MAG: hypothetical protein R2712_20615 [Vicinamibacterales bacterium]